MRKKGIALLVATTMVMALLAGCGNQGSTTEAGDDATATGSESQEATAANEYNLITDGVLRVGVDDTMPPMEYRDESNELVGFDIDMGNEIASRLGLEIEWVPTDWDGLLLGLSSKKYDAVISVICITEEREKTMDFSDPYYVLEELIITGKDNTEINGISDLPGKLVGCQTGSANYITLTEMDGVDEADVSQYNAVTDELQDISTGRLDCAVMESPTAYYYAQLQDGLRVVDDPLEGHDAGVVFDKGNDQLREAVNDVLKEMKEDGTLSELSVKWFGVDIYAE